VRWIASPPAVIAVLLSTAATESSDIPTATKSRCSLSSSDGLEQVLRLIQEEQSVTDIDSSETSNDLNQTEFIHQLGRGDQFLYIPLDPPERESIRIRCEFEMIHKTP